MPDHTIIEVSPKKFGFADRMFRNIALDGDEPNIEDYPRDQPGMWTIGYTGQVPERMKMHMANQHTFDRTTLRPSAARRRRLSTVCRGLLGHARDEPPRHAEPLRHVQAGGRRRPDLPRPVSAWNATATTCWPKASIPRLGNPGRLSRIHHADAGGSGLGRRSDASERGRLRGAIDARMQRRWRAASKGIARRIRTSRRSTGRPTFRAASSGSRSSMAAPLRQRQGPRRGLDLPRSGAAAPRAALYQPA